MGKKFILGQDSERDFKLKNKTIWFKGRKIGSKTIFRTGIAKVRGVETGMYGLRIYINMITELSKEHTDDFNPFEWEIHKGDKVEILTKKEAFFYQL